MVISVIDNIKNKEKQMGHKGVSKRKPKKLRQVPAANTGGSSNGRTPVQSLVKDKSAPVNRDGMNNPSAGSNKTQKKH